MKFYLIGGLGADERVFQCLQLNMDCKVIKWIKPYKNEALDSYTLRILPQIEQHEKFALLGVSFGGIVAIEIAKIIKPELLILISSVTDSKQFPLNYKLLGKISIHFLPNILIKPPRFLQNYLFGARNKELLNAIIADTDPDFVRWALISIIRWNGSANETAAILRIHGTKDRLIPLQGNAIKILNGGHFMIVDRATEISQVINEEMVKMLSY